VAPLLLAGGLDELAFAPAYLTNAARVEHYADLQPRLAATIFRRNRQAWIDLLMPPACRVRR